MKSPKKTFQARSSVRSRASQSSPEWKSATQIFKTPKSPSPKKRVTKRTSVYQKQQAAGVSKLPKASVVSPPGVKTRARRSSIYHQQSGMLVSPPMTRTRRASMYVASKSKTDKAEVFTKVWATPVRKPEPIAELSPRKTEKSTSTPMTKVKSQKKAAGPASPAISLVHRSESSAKKTTRTPTPNTKSAKSLVIQKSVKTVAEERIQVIAVSQSPNKKSKRQATVLTSTPSKSLKEMTGKSFYSTPGETPIQNKRTDDVFVFSAVPPKSVAHSARKAFSVTPVADKSSMKRPVRSTPARKSIASKRGRQSTGDEATPAAKKTKASVQDRTSKVAKRTITSTRSTPRVQKINMAENSFSKPTPLSPLQMASIVQSASKQRRQTVRRSEKRKASATPEKRTKRARVVQDISDECTPRVVKIAKRRSPKKLNITMEKDCSSNDTSLLNQTFDMDSRSIKCTIL